VEPAGVGVILDSSWRFLKLTVVFAVIHGAVFLFSFVTAFSRGMNRFDHPEVPETLLERICAMATSILIEPYGVLAEKVGIHNRFLDWTGMLLNSLLWGAALSLFFMLLSKQKSSANPA
jgi:hypothetical protein